MSRNESFIRTVLEYFERTYPDARCGLEFQNPYQLLAATILSAQCTDKRVNLVTPSLFRA
ncbi:MAG: endonuclease III, partial [Deltaproteobacteria bacterium]|nr:endonuclease III [Deltaproteobacteria bacterium]